MALNREGSKTVNEATVFHFVSWNSVGSMSFNLGLGRAMWQSWAPPGLESCNINWLVEALLCSLWLQSCWTYFPLCILWVFRFSWELLHTVRLKGWGLGWCGVFFLLLFTCLFVLTGFLSFFLCFIWVVLWFGLGLLCAWLLCCCLLWVWVVALKKTCLHVVDLGVIYPMLEFSLLAEPCSRDPAVN